MAENQPRGIPIDQISIQDLSQLQQQIEKEVTFFTESLQELQGVQRKFKETCESVMTLAAKKDHTEALIPLTESMYVHGKLSEPDKVIIDIGTGYLVEMPLKQGIAYFERKQEYLQKQLDQVGTILLDKDRTKTILTEALQDKIQQQLASQPQPAK